MCPTVEILSLVTGGQLSIACTPVEPFARRTQFVVSSSRISTSTAHKLKLIQSLYRTLRGMPD